MKDLAKHIVKAGLPLRRGQPRRRLADAMQQQSGTGDSPEVPSSPAPLFGEALDSWEPRHRPEVEKEVLEARTATKKGPETPNEPAPEPSDYETVDRSTRRMKRSKTRRAALSISVSEEEAELLRRHAGSLDQSFSSWARNTLFRAMGRKPPARPQRD